MGKLRTYGIWMILTISTLIFLYPDLKQAQLKQKAEKVTEYGEAYYEKMITYNQKLLEDGQNLADCWNYEQEYDFTAGSEAVGEIRIEALELELPLYLGATGENMAKGAAVLAQSSMPVGGESTNCVIAAHRGYSGLPFFRQIDELKPGDKVELINARETLQYVVERMEIILPTDLACLEIQEGRDLVTLISCHPYMGGGRFRYVVYCKRNQIEESVPAEPDTETNEVKVSAEILENMQMMEELEKVEQHIPFTFQREEEIRRGLYVIFMLVWIWMIAEHIRTRRRRG